MQLILLLNVLIFSTCLAAATPTSATLDFATHDGKKKHFSVEWRSDGVFAGNKKISDIGLLGGRGHLARLLDAKTLPPSTGCSAGRFVHTVKRGTKTTTEAGCISDARFDVKVRSFERILRIAWRTR